MNVKLGYVPVQGIVGVWGIVGVNENFERFVKLCGEREHIDGNTHLFQDEGGGQVG